MTEPGAPSEKFSWHRGVQLVVAACCVLALAVALTLFDQKPAGAASASKPKISIHALARGGGHPSDLEALLASDPSKRDLQDAHGKTPLRVAVEAGQTMPVITLLNYGADPNILAADGLAPLHVAAQSVGAMSHIHLLLSPHYFGPVKGKRVPADPNIVGAAPAGLSVTNWTPLHWAAREGNDMAAHALLMNRASPNSRDSANRTPLHIVAKLDALPTSRPLAVSPFPSARRHGALALSSSRGSILTTLLVHRADANATDADNRTPLHEAAKTGFLEGVQTLLRERANPNLCDSAGATPLHEAAAEGYDEIVEELLRRRADRDAKNAAGETALDLAKRGGHAKVMALLEAEPGHLTGHQHRP
jgi:ankyrin repeat protein